jgi:hypothetical protein
LRKLVTERLFDVGEPHGRPPQFNTRLSPDVMRRFMAQCATEGAQRYTIFDAAVTMPKP